MLYLPLLFLKARCKREVSESLFQTIARDQIIFRGTLFHHLVIGKPLRTSDVTGL
jgi:hypothetical protein